MIWLFLGLWGTLGALDFAGAKERLLERHPSLRAAQIDIEQSEWDMQAANLRPNPTLSLDYEGYVKPQGDNQNNISIFISQPFETGGKRSARQEVACTQWQKATLKKQVEALRLLNAFKKAFILAAFKQEEMRLAHRDIALAEKNLVIVGEKVKGGKLALLDENKSRLELALAKTKLLDHEKEARGAFLTLLRFWGEDCQAEELSYPFDQCEAASPQLCLEEHPQARLDAQDSWVARALLRAARADRYPDLSLGVGYNPSFKGNDSSFLAGLEMPLPVFDRNEAAIQKSWLDVERQDRQYGLTLQHLKYDQKIKQEAFLTSLQQIQIIRDEALVWAKRSEVLIQEGVAGGKLGQEELQRAQATVLEHEKALLEAYLQYHLALVDLEYFYSESL